MTKTAIPAIEGWFTDRSDAPALIGSRCTACGTIAFPKATAFCPNPGCTNQEFVDTELSRTGTIWSFTNNCYQPPPPFVAPSEPFEPFIIAAVELAAEGIVVLGQMVRETDIESLRAGLPVELVVDTLFEDDEHTHTVWKWKVAV